MEIEYAIFFHLAKSCPWAVPGLNFSFYHLCLIRPSHLPSILSRKLPSKLISTFTNKYNGNTGKNLGRDELGLSGASRSPLLLFYYLICSLFFQGLEKVPPIHGVPDPPGHRGLSPQKPAVAHGGSDPGPETLLASGFPSGSLSYLLLFCSLTLRNPLFSEQSLTTPPPQLLPLTPTPCSLWPPYLLKSRPDANLHLL